MPKQAQAYIYSVIAAGTVVLLTSLTTWSAPNSFAFAIYLVLAMLASLAKLRLPGIVGMYSLNFLFLLFGVIHFTVAETVIAGCLGALVQSVCNARKRPTFVQILFNMANLTLSVGVCFLVIHRIAPAALNQYRPAQMAVVAFLYFVTNTVVVSGVLALLQGKRLAEVCQEWYIWYLPYYLIGAAAVGLLPFQGQPFNPEAWLILLPLVYLVHFFLGLLDLRPQAGGAAMNTSDTLPAAARLYLMAVLTAAAIVLVSLVLHWNSENQVRFISYLALTAVAATLKVRLPGIRGTLSMSFVPVLAAIVELSLGEAFLMSMVAGIVQCAWRPKRRPVPVQVLFNGACLALSTALAYLVCEGARPWIGHSLGGLLAIAALVKYGSNTLMVATVLCLAERKPLCLLWQNCHFWSCPYYLVGAAAAGLMVAASRAAGWGISLSVLPLMLLVYISYRSHLLRVQSALWGS